MIRRIVAAAVLVCIAGGPARADPLITPLLIGLAGISVTGTVATVAATLLSAVVTTAIGIGLQLLFTPRAAKPPPPENGAIAVRSTTPYSAYAFGTVRMAGTVICEEEIGGYLIYVAAIARQNFVRHFGLYLNDDLVAITPTMDILDSPVPAGADGRYGNNAIIIATRTGKNPEASYVQITALAPTIWDANHKGNGVSSLSMICKPVKQRDFAKVYPNIPPIPSIIGDSLALFDPRDVTQNILTISTYQFSKNPVLALLYWEVLHPFGTRRSYFTAILPVLAYWIQAANDCDDLVALRSGGTEKRYEMGGWLTTEQPGLTTRQTILACCDGHFVERGDGTCVIRVGKYTAPTVTLTDDNIIGLKSDRGLASDQRINQITARWSSPDNGYALVEGTPLIDAADQTVRPGGAKNAQVDLPWVQSTGQASRLLKRQMIRQQERRRGTLQLNLSGINACYERWVLVQSNSLPWLNGRVIEIVRPTISIAELFCSVNFIGSGPQIDTYNAATDESAAPAVPQRPATVGLPVPANVVVVAEQTNDASGAASIFLDVSWDLPLFNGSPWLLNYLVQWRTTDTGAGAGNWTQQSFSSPTIAASRVSVATGSAITGVTLDVQVFSSSIGASLSTGSVIQTVSTAITTTAPAAPSALTATGGTGSAVLSCRNPNSANFAAVRFYRAAHGASFATATLLGSPVYGAPNGTSSYTDTVAPGTYDYFATAQNSGGTASGPVGPVVATVT